MTYLSPDLPNEALQAYAHTANFYYTQAWRNGIPMDYTTTSHSPEEENRFGRFVELILKGDLEALQNSKELNPLTVNYRDEENKQTLVHVAYRFNQPKIIEFLLKKGANDKIPDIEGDVPLAIAHEEYNDSSSTVIKEITSQCLQKNSGNTPDLHDIFDTTLEFIRNKKWTFVRHERESFSKVIPFRDGTTLASLGLPHLSYRVNCYDLSRIFSKIVKQFGMQANEIEYSRYKSIKREDRKVHNVIGQMFLFNESEPADSTNFEFYYHCVAYSSGWYFDLTLMCKYQDKDAILAK